MFSLAWYDFARIPKKIQTNPAGNFPARTSSRIRARYDAPLTGQEPFPLPGTAMLRKSG
jgi:hypothetical protein